MVKVDIVVDLGLGQNLCGKHFGESAWRIQFLSLAVLISGRTREFQPISSLTHRRRRHKPLFHNTVNNTVNLRERV